MDLCFATKRIKSVCERSGKAYSVLGIAAAEALHRRIADLMAAKTIYDILLGNPRLVQNASGGKMAIDISEEYILIISANHTTNPLTSDKRVDWTRVRRVKVLKIEGKDD